MARRELGPASLAVARQVAAHWPGGEVLVGVSGGADSWALALGARWAAEKLGGSVQAMIVDHGLQPSSAHVARSTARELEEQGIPSTVVAVSVPASPDGLEAAAREARLAALAAPGLPVLLGHTLDDQAEQVLLGIVRGSGTRSIAGMAERRGRYLRPLLGIRRATAVQACEEWGITYWQDPMNDDETFMRVRVRRALEQLQDVTGRDLAPNLARTAILARADADALDALAELPDDTPHLPVGILEGQPAAIRWRRIKRWLERRGATPEMTHVLAVDKLITNWHGQGTIAVPGAQVLRRGASLTLVG